MATRPCALTIPFALLLAACAGSEALDADVEPGPDDGHDAGETAPADLTGEAACARLGAAICAGVDACCDAVELPFRDGADCAAEAAAACVAMGASELAAVATGAAAVDGEALVACELAWEAAAGSCRVPEAALQARHCRGVFVAAAPPGGACPDELGGLPCAGGDGLCFPEPSGVTCRTWAAAGQPCATAPCPPWRHCVPGDGGLVCDAPRDIGGRCGAPVHCRPGLRCEQGVCAAGRAGGEGCRPFECGAGLVCDPFEERCGEGAREGDACISPLHCAEGLACVGLSIGLVCVPGEAEDGGDEAGLPGFLEPCDGECAQGLVCAEGPLAGRCAGEVCAL